MSLPASPLRLRLNKNALLANWRWLRDQGGGAACGAAIKADGYGTDAAGVLQHLADAGCRDFFVATWAEALVLLPLAKEVRLSVLHGLREEDMPVARQAGVKPVLNTAQQVQRWKDVGGGPCDVMADTGINRLGLGMDQAFGQVLDGLQISTLMSHLACADTDHPLNILQLERFSHLRSAISAERYSLANSAGICLGRNYAFDLMRPGLALYGGVPREEARGHIRQVAFPEAQILQRKAIGAGDGIGYNATQIARHDMELAILNIGYADGYLRNFSSRGAALATDGTVLPVVGRVSMDLLIVDVSSKPELKEGDWVTIDYQLERASALSGLSQYELLTGLGRRLERYWQ
ncbi:alanine racemase [Rhizorhapis sp. SPR117]|uniref:alanine racemase n=1 Tax=Rhizorhapis sp. SPR117 TaxID=2912611 RepID=UPI001F012239|nr:alanine racemase [Rhizorhapis sp. SPR117]